MALFRRITLRLRSFFSGKKGLAYALALGTGLLTVMVLPAVAHAGTCGIGDPGSCVALIFIKIFQLLTALMGFIMIMEVDALIKVAQYFNFVSPGPSAVRIGWIVTRDLANMFFIVFLLIIAFGTIFDVPQYSYQKNLQRLLIMAVVINFSKTICGIFIDMGQVVMLTFVNGFKDAAAGNFLTAFQINKVLSLADGQGDGDFGLVLAMMLAFVIVATAAAVVLVMLVMMVFRVVMLWVLIVLSPLAFMASAVPEGRAKYAEWWGEFKKNILAGPVLAFFLWLALASVQSANGNFATENTGNGGFNTTTAAGVEVENAAQFQGTGIPTDAGRTDTILSLVIATSILFAGLKFAGSSGAVGAGFANTVRGKLGQAGRAVALGGAKRFAQPFMTGGGKVLAKVPLVGGLGRAAVLTGEKWKKDRQGFAEKFAGTPEDMARLSPGAFARRVGGLKDPKEIERFLKAGASNPAAMAALASRSSINPLNGQTVMKGAGKDALMSMIKGGDAVGAAKLVAGDKRLADMAKADPELLTALYQGQLDEAKLDPNKGKDVGAFEQKFASQLVKPDENGKTMMDPGKLKNIVPKMSSEDIGGLLAGDMSTFMPHMNASQMRKLAQDGTPDQQDGMLKALGGMDAKTKKDVLAKLGTGDVPASWYADNDIADNVLDRTKGDAKARGEAMAKGGPALSARADARLAEAMAGKTITRPDGSVTQDINVDEILASLPDAINAGTLSSDRILSDPKIQGYINNNPGKIDLASLARNNAPATREAAQALAASVINADPERAGRMKGEMYQDIRPSKAMMERASSEDTKAQAAEASVEKARESAEIEKKAADESARTKEQASKEAARTEIAAASEAARIRRESFAAAQRTGDDAMARGMKRSDTLDRTRGQGGPYETKNREESSRLKGAVGNYDRVKKEAADASAKYDEAAVKGTYAEQMKASRAYEAAQEKLIQAAKDLEDTLKG